MENLVPAPLPTSPKAPRRVPETINRLKGPENFKFYKWFEGQEFAVGTTDEGISRSATEELGFLVTTGNVCGAWEATGKKRPTAEKSENQKLSIVKRAVETLYDSLALQLPPEWYDL